jgi:hypothetical protein
VATLNVTAYSYGTSTYGSHEFGEDSLPIVISASASVTGACERIQQSELLVSATSGVATIGGFTAAGDAIVSATSATTCSGQVVGERSATVSVTSTVTQTGNATFASGGTVTVTVSSGVTAAGEKFILEETDAQGYGSYLYGVGVYDLSDLQTVISATSTVACTAEKINVGSATLDGTATVSAIARRVALGSVLINGTSVTVATSTGNGTRVRTSAAPITVESTVVPASTIVRVRESSANPSATVSLTCDSVFMVSGAAALTGTATVAAICNRVRFGSGTPTANASITVLGFATRGGIASLTGVSTIVADSERIQQPYATIQPETVFTATCNRVQSTSGALSATSGTATIGREKWELIVNNSVTWTQIAA